MKKAIAIVLSLVTFLASISVPISLAQASATTLRFVQTPTVTLYSSISSTATSLRVTPYPKDLNGVKLTITDFGTNPTLTVDPKVTNYEEIISFTGIVDNGDNTATLTGLSRNLTSKYPYTSTGTGKTHGASAIVVFSNNPQLYNRLAAKENDESITGLWTFSQTPIGINPGGQPNSSETVNGVGQLATGAQAAAGTSAGSTAARLIIPASLGTSTCQFATTSVLVTPVGTGKLATGCFDATGAYTFTGLQTFNTGGILDTASSTFTASTTFTATTSIAASASAHLKLNTVDTTFPNTQGASSTVWANDGSGNMTSNSLANLGAWSLLNATTSTAAMSFATSTFAAAQHLRIHVFVPGFSGISRLLLRFNGDGGTNYGYALLTDGGSMEKLSTASQIYLGPGNGSTATTSPLFMTLDIYNASATAKRFTWSGTTNSSAALAPVTYSGSGVWSNTSSQITSVQFIADGAPTLNSGVNIAVYGTTQ